MQINILVLSETRDKEKELTGLCGCHIFQVSWDTTAEIDHQEQHNCKNYSKYKNIIDIVLMVILTTYFMIAHIALFHKYMFKLTMVNKRFIYTYIFYHLRIKKEKNLFFTVSKSMKYSYLSKTNFTYPCKRMHYYSIFLISRSMSMSYFFTEHEKFDYLLHTTIMVMPSTRSSSKNALFCVVA